jgi:hypothetical protein
MGRGRGRSEESCEAGIACSISMGGCCDFIHIENDITLESLSMAEAWLVGFFIITCEASSLYCDISTDLVHCKAIKLYSTNFVCSKRGHSVKGALSCLLCRLTRSCAGW